MVLTIKAMVDAPKMAASTEPDFLEKTVRVTEADVSEGSFRNNGKQI
jgi:hypothetical protein